MSSLRVTLPNGGGVLQAPTVVGRGSQAQLDCPDLRVSRRHLQLRQEGETWIAEDLGSRYGTWMDGFRVDRVEVTEPMTLRLGDAETGFPLQLAPVDSVGGAPGRRL